MQNNKKVIALWAPSPGVGATFTAINMAKTISESGKKVILLDFDLKTSLMHLYLDSDDKVHCLDNVLPFTMGGQELSPEVIINNIQKIEGFDYLRGTGHPDQSQYIKIESLFQIIAAAKSLYDYVIIDTHSLLDNPGTYTALEGADMVFIVAEKNVVTIQGFGSIKGLLFENFKRDKFKLIVNKDSKDVFMEPEDIKNYYETSVMNDLPALDSKFRNSLNQGKWMDFLYGKNKIARSYVRALNKIVEELVVPNKKQKKDNTNSLRGEG